MLPIRQVAVPRHTFTLCKREDQWYLVNDIEGILAIPQFVGQSLNNENRFTYWIGPYAFVNNFETTAEGKYLIKMLEYRTLSPRAQQKVNHIKDMYGFWVQVDTEFMEILRKRDESKC